jgi:phosphoglycolate phosphatase-like HAD superfamily hydrolase
MERLNAGVEGTVMVGDSLYDAEASEALGVDFCVALWGYGFDNPADIEKHKNVLAAKDVGELEKFLFI